MRIKHHALPGVSWEDVSGAVVGGELARRDVFLRGEYVGQIIYRRRRLRDGGSEYGWQRAEATKQSGLLDAAGAIGQLLRQP